MAKPVIMPRLGQSVESCLITAWYKKPGDTVKEGDLLFAYETDKATFDEEARDEGLLLEIFFEEGDEVPVLENICVIGKSGESIEEFRPKILDGPSGSKGSTEILEESSTIPLVQPSLELVVKPPVSPRARKKAAELGLDITGLTGTGARNRIIEKDVVHWSESAPKITPLAKKKMQNEKLMFDRSKYGAGSRVTTRDLIQPGSIKHEEFRKIPLSKIRRIIADNMHRSLKGSAQLTHHLSADARKLLELRTRIKEKPESLPNITINDMVCFAVIKCLKEQSYMNAHFKDDFIEQYHDIHLGMAVDTDRGLMVPTLRNADQFNLEGLSEELKKLAGLCQKGSIDPDILDPESATFTVSNLGVFGIEMFTPVLNLPQVGILGINTIKPQVIDLGQNNFDFVPHIGLSLTYDHRAVDGAPASAFLKTLKETIESFSA